MAVEFESEADRMHIGTQGEDALADRALAGMLPARWWRDCEGDGQEAGAAAPAVWTPPRYQSLPPINGWREVPYPENTFLIEIDPDSVTVSLPPLGPGDRGELQFVVAWAARHDADDVSTWFAVERDPREILGQAGCT